MTNYCTNFIICPRQNMTTSNTTVSISGIERDTGLSKDTLRVWERRYGFPQPGRDAFGERAYSQLELEKLRVIRRLMDAGHRPGRLAVLSIAELLRLGERPALTRATDAGTSHSEIQSHLDLIQAHDIEGLQRSLGQAQARLGLAAFMMKVVAPLNVLVGQAWACGELDIFKEHLYTECVQSLLRNAIHNIPPPALATRPRVMLTTFPKEVHGIGLLMAQTMFALQGCTCLSLGTQTPVPDIASAAAAYKADIVALSFTTSISANVAFAGLIELRQTLPASIEIWVGGNCPSLQRRNAPQVQQIGMLSDITTHVEAWRTSHPL
jgi:MerR family transcriptional regulator, light-induced transcriptional regulator